VEQFGAFLARTLERLATGDQAHTASALVDHGRAHGLTEVGRLNACERELHDVGGIDVVGVGREGRGGRMLDALVDRQDRHVARARKAPVVVDRLQVAQDVDGPVAQRDHPVDEVRPR
jgi:hypothetical protein